MYALSRAAGRGARHLVAARAGMGGAVMTPTTIELFAGIGGFCSPHTHALALVEKEPTCRAVLRRHHPAALILDDVRTAGRHNLPWANIVKFGFPCQDLSVAGARAGLSGARSGLFYEAVRIVDELQPDFAIWENVPGLLSSGAGRDFLAVLTALDSIGYCGAWSTLDAQFFGVAQRRQRVFGVFARRDIGAECCAEILSLAARLPWNIAPRSEARARVAATIRAGSSGDGNKPGRRGDDDQNIVVAGAQSASHGGADDDDAQAGHIVAVSFAENQHGELRTSNIAAQLTAGGGKPGQGYPAVLVPLLEIGKRTNGDGYRDGDGIGQAGAPMYTLQAGAQHGIGSTFGVRRLTPRECERLQGFEDDDTAWGIDEAGARVEMSNSTRYRMLGNAVNRKVSAWIDSQVVKHGYGY